ncbi:MAG: D-alanyl-D-alanine carboxypeptidase family protein [Oscillospiraceae bacterium]|nr:D-alanyl-D-alanine carboxypeptidase family protein [Oscillospiraceae bacterium]
MNIGKITAALVLILLGGILCRSCYLRETQPNSVPSETSAGSQTETDSIPISETTTAQTSETTVSAAVETTTTKTTETTTETTTTTVTETTVTTTTTTTEAIGVESISLTFYEVQLYIGESKMPIVTMHPENATDKSELWSSSDESIASVNSYGKITAKAVGSCIITVVSCDNPEVMAQVSVTVTEPPVTEPPATEPPTELPQPIETLPTETVPTETKPPAANGPTYIGGILIANKTYPLPKDYNPGLDPTCKSQFEKLRKAAAAEGLNIYLSSGFRSYEYQTKVYNSFLNAYGQAKTDTLSARPGHSEHQTGLAIDVNTVNDSFAATKEAAWLAAHAHEFGFIIRYPKGKEHITGYKYEPWHIRYLGEDTAAKVYNSGLTLEEYLGITSCYSY